MRLLGCVGEHRSSLLNESHGLPDASNGCRITDRSSFHGMVDRMLVDLTGLRACIVTKLCLVTVNEI